MIYGKYILKKNHMPEPDRLELPTALPLSQRTLAVALAGMAALYLCLVAMQVRPQALATWRRWSYAGFYVDEFYTRLTLRLWPARWTAAPAHTGHPLPLATAKALPSGQH